MFYPGTKISIVESSVKKKSLGVKRGSLCNIVNSSQPVFLHPYGCVGCHCLAYFTRFGLEKQKDRLERKRFINLFPVMGNSKLTTGKVDRQIDKIFKSDLMGINRELNVDLSMPVVIACPTGDTTIDLASDHREFTAWFHSVLTSNLMTYVANTDPLDQHYRRFNEVNDEGFVQLLHTLVHSRNSRQSYVGGMDEADHGRRERLIRRIQALISIYARSNINSIYKSTHDYVRGASRMPMESFYTNLVMLFFNNSIKQMLNTQTKESNKLRMDNTIITGDHVRGLSHRTLGVGGDDHETKEN